MGGHLQLYVAKKMMKGKDIKWKFFTVLRDPKERLISLYNYVTTSGLSDHEKFSGMNWESFLQHVRDNDMSMCHMFHPSGLFEKADAAIKRHKISVYTLAEYSELLKDLSREMGRSLRQFHRNKTRTQHNDIEESPLVSEVLKEDQKLYQAALSNSYRFNLREYTLL